MTVCAGLIKNGKVFVGADSFWGCETYIDSNSDTGKLIKVGNSLVAIAGVANLRDAAEEVNTDNLGRIISSKKDARDLAKDILQKSKEMFEAGNSGCKGESIANGEMIIATKTKLYRVQQDLSVFDCDKYVAIGAGEAYATAILEFVTWKSPGPATLKYALETACQLSPFCQLPLDIREVK